jgi:conjugal transfer pilin signal peptidase TrbI
MSITVLSKIDHRFNLVLARLEPGVKTLLRHFGKYRRFYVVLLVSEFLVLMLVLNNYRLMFNVTESLPYKVFLIKVDDHVSTGDFVAFHLHTPQYPDGFEAVKRVLASPGENVFRHDHEFIIGDRHLAAKTEGIISKHLTPNLELVEGENTLAAQRYFVAGDHEYSLDSRYDKPGLIHQADIFGRAIPLF